MWVYVSLGDAQETVSWVMHEQTSVLTKSLASFVRRSPKTEEDKKRERNSNIWVLNAGEWRVALGQKQEAASGTEGGQH